MLSNVIRSMHFFPVFHFSFPPTVSMLKMAPKEGEVEAAALWPWMEPFHLPERLWFFRTCLSAENRSCIGTSNRIYPRNPCREIHHWLLKGESISPLFKQLFENCGRGSDQALENRN